MKYSLATTALVGAILAATSSATPISQNSLSAAASTLSFSPDYKKVAGNFTAIAGSSPTTPALSSTFDFSGFPANVSPGPVVLQSGNPELSTPLSISIIGTPTKTSVAGSATDRLFPAFIPHFGHGPVVPGRGFNHTQQPSNSTVQKPKLAPTYSTFDDVVSHQSYPDNRCKYYSMRWMCERWMRIDRWWNEGRVSYHEHASHEAHHKLTFHHARSIHMDFNSSNSSDVVIPALNSKSTPIRLPEHSIKATPSPTPGHSKAPTPAKKSSTSTKAKHMTHADRVRAGKELEHKMREQEKKIDFYRKSIVKTKQEIDNLKKLRDDSAKQILELKERDSYEMEELKKTEIEMRQLMVEKKRLGYPGWGWIELVSAVITDKA